MKMDEAVEMEDRKNEELNDENKKHVSSSAAENNAINETKKAYVYKPTKTKSFVTKNTNCAELNSMSHDQLVAECKKLQNHVIQLKNLVNKSAQQQTQSNGNNKLKKKFKERPFDFKKFNKRHVLLKFAYLGWNYQGYTIQEGISNTVEHEMFEAFKRTKLIESRETSNYHRCGRTDKGVSAFSQVISIDFRSNCASGDGVVLNPESEVKNHELENEINYVKQLNGVLPDEIRVVAWSPVKNEHSARFDCTKRIYRYYFPKGDLDIDLMRDAGRRLVGERDYRNFCKMDVGNGVVTFFRRIDNITVHILDQEPSIYSTVELIVEGSSFLWHQIRCIVAVLFLVGQKREEPSIIDDLLNIDKYPCKPQYTMSCETPLVLFDCQYEGVDWLFDRNDLEKTIKHMQDMWLVKQTQATITKRMIDHLELDLSNASNKFLGSVKKGDDAALNENKRTIEQPYRSLQGKSQALNYVKFSQRQKAHSLEDRVEHYVKKRRLDSDVYSKLAENESLAKSLNIYQITTNNSIDN